LKRSLMGGMGNIRCTYFSLNVLILGMFFAPFHKLKLWKQKEANPSRRGAKHGIAILQVPFANHLSHGMAQGQADPIPTTTKRSVHQNSPFF